METRTLRIGDTRGTKRPIAQQIEAQLGGTWRAVRNGFGWKWEDATGRVVRAYSESVMDYTGWSDSVFNTVFIEDKTGRRVFVH